MIRMSTSWMYQQSLNTMLSQQSSLSNTQQQVSTGKRINVASDDPIGAARQVTLTHIIAGNDQYTTNINAANTRLSTESNVLSSMSDVLNSVNDLGLQGINGTLSSADRGNLATELTQLRDQMLQLANTTDANGQALFAGTSNTRTPFQLNADGSGNYSGNDTQARTAIGPQLSVANTDTGSALLMNLPAGNGQFVASAASTNTGGMVVGDNSVTDPAAFKAATASGPVNDTVTFDASGNWTVTDASGNPVTDAGGNPITGSYTDGASVSFNGMTVNLSGMPAAGDSFTVRSGTKQDIFTTLSNMIDTLSSGADGTPLSNSLNRQLESVGQAIGQISNTAVSVGTRINTLQQKQSDYADLKVTYQGTLSKVQNVDMASAISKLSLQATALQASQQTFAKVQGLSLFDYIK